MSQFTQTMYDNAHRSSKGLNTGEPDAPIRHTWAQVHERARRVAGGLAAAGVGLLAVRKVLKSRTRGAAAPAVSSIPLVFLGRLVLVMHSTLIGYAIGYLPNQDPPGYPGLLI